MEESNPRDEELAVISCIFPEEWHVVKQGSEYQMKFDLENGQSVKIEFLLPDYYPTAQPPQWKLVSRIFSFSDEQQAHIQKELTALYEMERGPIIFKWIHWFKDHLPKFLPIKTTPQKFLEDAPASQQHQNTPAPPAPSKHFHIIHGAPITDRKSKFIASMVRVSSTEDVSEVFAQMKSDRNFGSATHIITAVRIRTPDNKLNELRNDDGETGAGDKLLFMLAQMKVENVMVMVSRWFGGIQLGPDRFKHITNQARAILANIGDLPALVSSSEEVPYTKQRSGADAFNRIRWDASYDKERTLVGIEEKTIIEMKLSEVESKSGTELSSLLSNIRYLKYDGNVIWDPRANLDKLFKQ